MRQWIDLHMHSLCSDDGDFTPTQLVSQCEEAGIKIMAIADHNSVKGVEEGLTEANKKGILLIPAIEIDCTFKGINLHVVGYNIDYKQSIFNELEENIMKQEIACSMEKLRLTNALGFELTKEQLEELSSNGVYTGEMFGEVLLADERYTDHELLKPYREGGNRSDNPFVNFYWDFYAQGKPCYTKIVYPTLEETIKIINTHGGVAVLAHPGNNLKGKYEVFDEMVKVGIQGVEAFSSYHSEEAVEYFLKKGREYNLLVTCGSDYHGKTKPSIHLGENKCTIDPQIIEDDLKAYRLI